MLFEELLVFAGLMATLGCITKVVLAIINRRRTLTESGSAPLLTEITQRLARLEHAVDATAIEVERIAEGQRFTTKLLAERSSAAAGADAARSRPNTPH
jgi:hypothetical protein